LFAIFIDEYHLTPGEGVFRARQWLARFVEERLGPRDLLTIAKPLDSLVDLRLTHDRQALQTAIERFDGRKGDYTPRSPFERNYIAAAPARLEIVRSQ